MKVDYNIESSEHMNDAQWTQLEAELVAAKVSTRCFRSLIEEIRAMEASSTPEVVPEADPKAPEENRT